MGRGGHRFSEPSLPKDVGNAKHFGGGTVCRRVFYLLLSTLLEVPPPQAGLALPTSDGREEFGAGHEVGGRKFVDIRAC